MLELGNSADDTPQESLSTTGKDVCHNPGSATSSTLVSESTAVENPVTQTVIIVRQPGDPRPPFHTGADMVEHTTAPVEWQGCSPPCSRHDDRYGCITDRVGSSFQRCVHRRTVVPGGKETSHQSPGASSGFLCSASLHKGQEEYTRTPPYGQQHCPLLCHQDGGDPLKKPDGSSLSPTAVVSTEGHNIVSRAPARCEQSGGRQGVSISSDISRMETAQESLSGCVPEVTSGKKPVTQKYTAVKITCFC